MGGAMPQTPEASLFLKVLALGVLAPALLSFARGLSYMFQTFPTQRHELYTD
jgi:hypothetical protein